MSENNQKLRDKSGLFTVSTCWVFDRKDTPYETALLYKSNDDVDIKVFEIYTTWKEAEIGHFKWMERAKTMSSKDFNDYKDVVEDYYSAAIDLMFSMKWLFNKKN